MTRINERIRAPKVRVVIEATNENLGVMNTPDAVRRAKELGLDLVEVASKVDPPVCRITEYGKWKYQQSKQKKERNKQQKGGKQKEIKFRVGIDPHDYQIKLRHAEDFLDENNKVRVQLQFRGRQMAHKEIGFQLMEKVQQDLITMAHVDVPPRMAGRSINMVLSPLPAAKRKRKWSKVVGELKEEDEDDHDDEEEDDDDEHEEEDAS